jgi:hypothetical protein
LPEQQTGTASCALFPLLFHEDAQLDTETCMTTLILHPGSPKTATSTLQQLLRVNRARLSAEGVGLILPEDIRGKQFLGKYLAAYRGNDIADMDDVTRDFFRPFLHGHHRVICTEETFCHDFMPSRKMSSGGIDRSETAARILSQSGASETQVVLSIRPQVDFIISTYTHFVHRHRETRDFSSWLSAEVDLPKVMWQPAVDAFRTQFGRENVDVVSLAETKRTGMDGYLQLMLERLGVGHLKLDSADGQVHNPSPSQRAVHLCRVMNREIANQVKSEMVNSFLIDTYPVKDFGKFTPQKLGIPDDICEAFRTDHDSALS